MEICQTEKRLTRGMGLGFRAVCPRRHTVVILLVSLRLGWSLLNRLDKDAAIGKNYYFLHASTLPRADDGRNSPDGATLRKYVGIRTAQGTPWKMEAFLLKAWILTPIFREGKL